MSKPKRRILNALREDRRRGEDLLRRKYARMPELVGGLLRKHSPVKPRGDGNGWAGRDQSRRS